MRWLQFEILAYAFVSNHLPTKKQLGNTHAHIPYTDAACRNIAVCMPHMIKISTLYALICTDTHSAPALFILNASFVFGKVHVAWHFHRRLPAGGKLDCRLGKRHPHWNTDLVDLLKKPLLKIESSSENQLAWPTAFLARSTSNGRQKHLNQHNNVEQLGPRLLIPPTASHKGPTAHPWLKHAKINVKQLKELCIPCHHQRWTLHAAEKLHLVDSNHSHSLHLAWRFHGSLEAQWPNAATNNN